MVVHRGHVAQTRCANQMENVRVINVWLIANIIFLINVVVGILVTLNCS